MHSHLHFAPSTRTISAEGCPRQMQNALSPAFRALDTHDRVARDRASKRTLACVLRARHARSPQRVARAKSKTHSRLHFAPLTRTISAEGCAGQPQTRSRLHFAHSTRTISAEGCVSCSGGTAPGLKRESLLVTARVSTCQHKATNQRTSAQASNVRGPKHTVAPVLGSTHDPDPVPSGLLPSHYTRSAFFFSVKDWKIWGEHAR